MHWIIPANSNVYNHFESFYDNGFIDWHQSAKYEIGDTVYVYLAKPHQRICFETIVERNNMSSLETFDDSKYWVNENKRTNQKKFCRLKLVRLFNDKRLSLNELNKNGLKAAPQGPSRVQGELLNYIQSILGKDFSFYESDKTSDNNEAIDDLLSSIIFDSKKIVFSKISRLSVWPRSEIIKAGALKKADYLCEFDNKHVTFIRKKSNLNYTEAHHIIPLAMQGEDKFKNVNLDCIENIVSLCSNCHNKLHYGKDYKNILKKIYELRCGQLRKCGIDISFEELLDYYEF